MRPARDTVAAIAVVVILAFHAAEAVHALPRALDHDEAEHLRAAEWMASGKTMYRDFVENHTPFLDQILVRLAPAGAHLDDLESYIKSARLLSAFAGTLAALCVALFAVRASGHALAAAPVLAVLLWPGWTLNRSVLDVRAEPYTLLLFWGGTLLVLWSRTDVLNGLGAGLVCAAAIWNPKWPIEMVIVLAWYVRHARLRSLMIAAVPPLLMLAIALRATTFRELIFFGYRYPAAFYAWFRTSPLVTFSFPRPFEYCSWWFRPAIAIPAILAFAAVSIVERQRIERRLLYFLGAFVIAGAVELRFLYSYPRLWPQYFVMWGCSLAALYGVTIALIARRWALLLNIAPVLIALWFAAFALVRIHTPVDELHWGLKAAVLQRLQPGDGVWMDPPDCPFVAPAGSYYWYAYLDQVPFSLLYAHTDAARRWLPRLEDGDLPPCRMLDAHLHGLRRGDVFVRFMDERNVGHLPESKRCLAAMLDAKFARRVGNTTVVEILPVKERARTPPD